ncbi:hypothetical protein Hanom_Chr06g00547871 [Helianthus anomalus]
MGYTEIKFGTGQDGRKHKKARPSQKINLQNHNRREPEGGGNSVNSGTHRRHHRKSTSIFSTSENSLMAVPISVSDETDHNHCKPLRYSPNQSDVRATASANL